MVYQNVHAWRSNIKNVFYPRAYFCLAASSIYQWYKATWTQLRLGNLVSWVHPLDWRQIRCQNHRSGTHWKWSSCVMVTPLLHTLSFVRSKQFKKYCGGTVSQSSFGCFCSGGFAESYSKNQPTKGVCLVLSVLFPNCAICFHWISMKGIAHPWFQWEMLATRFRKYGY